VVIFAVYAHHRSDGFFLSPDSRAFTVHLCVHSCLPKKLFVKVNKPSIWG
jgi:hypothetical protein